MIDLSDMSTRTNGRGDELLCPVCGNWSRELLILEGDKVLCRECQKGAQKMRSQSETFRTEAKKGPRKRLRSLCVRLPGEFIA